MSENQSRPNYGFEILVVITVAAVIVGGAWAVAWSEVQQKRIESNERIALAQEVGE